MDIELEGKGRRKVALNATPKSWSKPGDESFIVFVRENRMTPDDYSNTLPLGKKNLG